MDKEAVGSVTVEREVDGGLETVKLQLPAVITYVFLLAFRLLHVGQQLSSSSSFGFANSNHLLHQTSAFWFHTPQHFQPMTQLTISEHKVSLRAHHEINQPWRIEC
jgi:hypothetical protein